MQMRIKRGKHTLIVGKTQSGKTTLVETLVAGYRRDYPNDAVIIINHKNEKSWERLLKSVVKTPRYRPGMIVNWSVLKRQNDDLEDFLDDVWEHGRKGKKALVVIDEGMSIPQNSSAIATLYTQGASLGVTMIMLTQRPVAVSLAAVTQSSHIVIFNLMGKSDLDRLDSYMVVNLREYIRPATDRRAGKSLAKWHYLHYSANDGTIRENTPLTIDRNLSIVANPKSTNGKPGIFQFLFGKNT